MSLRVLVVDDDADSLEMLCVWIRKWGYICDGATSGEEAIRMISAAGCPDVMISDLVMPTMSGLDLLRAIKTANVKCTFVLLTGHVSVSVAVSAIEGGADECLAKPIDPEALRVLMLKLESLA